MDETKRSSEMTRGISFTSFGWEDYFFWRYVDRKLFIKLSEIIDDCGRNPFSGPGKPERLRHSNGEIWSRRLDEKNRVTYCATDDLVLIMNCRTHYRDK
jgi:toxin YoeB